MSKKEKSPRIMILNPRRDIHIIKALASEIRLDILNLLQEEELNINRISEVLHIPQSTAATNIQTLEKAGLVSSSIYKGGKGNQKVCHLIYDEFIIRLDDSVKTGEKTIEVEMPLGLFLNYNVTVPCGICSPEKILGNLDTPVSFLNPDRVKAALIWFGSGSIDYQFPNNAYGDDRKIEALEFEMELSSEIPGTNSEWLSDISLVVNGVSLGIWTSPGDFGDKRGQYTPDWWKLKGSQYGILTNWRVDQRGTSVNGQKISDITLNQLSIMEHHSVRLKISADIKAVNAGGINIFGKGFGNYDRDILMRMHFSD
jgi:predicted transcriptional regulator